MQLAASIYLVVVFAMSFLSFGAYWLDKRRAGNGGRRIPERTLHQMAFLGGWPGAIMAQRRFRHKTQKASFRFAFWMMVVLHFAIVGAGIYFLIRMG